MCVCGYHVYQKVWEAAVKETLVCSKKAKIRYDQYVVAVGKNGTVIGGVCKQWTGLLD